MGSPDFKQLALRMVAIYTGVHLALTLVTFYTEHALSPREHLTAVNWALPCLAANWLILRGLCPLYRKDRLRAALLMPFFGGYLQLLLLVLPLACVAALMIGVGESLHEDSLWALFALVGVASATMLGQRQLIAHYEGSGRHA